MQEQTTNTYLPRAAAGGGPAAGERLVEGASRRQTMRRTLITNRARACMGAGFRRAGSSPTSAVCRLVAEDAASGQTRRAVG